MFHHVARRRRAFPRSVAEAVDALQLRVHQWVAQAGSLYLEGNASTRCGGVHAGHAHPRSIRVRQLRVLCPKANLFVLCAALLLSRLHDDICLAHLRAVPPFSLAPPLLDLWCGGGVNVRRGELVRGELMVPRLVEEEAGFDLLKITSLGSKTAEKSWV